MIGRILCFLGLHDLDMDSWRVINVWGDCFVTCRRDEAWEIVDGGTVRNYLLYSSTNKALDDIWNKVHEKSSAILIDSGIPSRGTLETSDPVKTASHIMFTGTGVRKVKRLK